MSTGEQRHDPVEALLDLVLYAPLGLITQLDELLPGLIERGRSQAVMARTIGEFAVRTGSKKVHGRAEDTQKLLEDAARTFLGILSDLAERVDSSPAASSSPDSASASRPTDGRTESAPAQDPDSAIAGYDDLKASEIIPLLDGLDRDQRAVIADRERSGRARKTILNRLTQLDRSE